MAAERFDWLMAGAGSAGRVLAIRPATEPAGRALSPGAAAASPARGRASRSAAETRFAAAATCRSSPAPTTPSAWAARAGHVGPDPMPVVHERLRVRRAEGVRVADCGIMPVIVSDGTNAPASMFGENAPAVPYRGHTREARLKHPRRAPRAGPP